MNTLGLLGILAVAVIVLVIDGAWRKSGGAK